MEALREFLDNMDWIQGLAIIAALEARAAYDPYFRLSFPKILQKSKWFLWVQSKFSVGVRERPFWKIQSKVYLTTAINLRFGKRFLINK
jgi:hypothetical protein